MSTTTKLTEEKTVSRNAATREQGQRDVGDEAPREPDVGTGDGPHRARARLVPWVAVDDPAPRLTGAALPG